MLEINEKQALSLETFKQAPSAVFLYTPWCGTCHAARKMLDILESIQPDIRLFACNFNIAPGLALRWKIESIPCVVLMKNGRLEQKIYAVRSVDFLYSRFVDFGVMQQL